MIGKTIYKNPISVWLLDKIVNFYTIPISFWKNFPSNSKIKDKILIKLKKYINK